MLARDIDHLQAAEANVGIDRPNSTYGYISGEIVTVATGDVVLQNGGHGTNISAGWIAYYLILMLIGTTGNSFVAYILVTRPFMKEKYIFTTSVCIAHVLFCLLVLSVVISYIAVNEMALKTPCAVIVCFLLGVTAYSMLSQAIRRFLALSERFRYANFTYQGKVINTVLIWMVSIVLALPYCVSYMYEGSMYDVLLGFRRNSSHTKNALNATNSNLTTHVPEMTSDHAHHHWLWIYSIVLLALQVILPSTTSLVLHSLTLCMILGRPNQTHWKKEINITKQHIIMQIIFLICWVPITILNLLADDLPIHMWIIRVFQLLAVSNCVYYPILYYFINAHIRREVKVALAVAMTRLRGTTSAS